MAPLQDKESLEQLLKKSASEQSITEPLLRFASDQSISELTKQNATKIVRDYTDKGLQKGDAHPAIILALEFDNTITAGMLQNRLANNEKINYIRELIGRPRIEGTKDAARDFIFEKPQPLTEDEIKKLVSAHDQLDKEDQGELQRAIAEFTKFELYEKGLGMRMEGTLDRTLAQTITGGGMVFIATKSQYTDEIKELLTERLVNAGYDKGVADSIGIVGSTEASNGIEPNKAKEHINHIKAEVEKAFKDATGNKRFAIGSQEICLLDGSDNNIKDAKHANHNTVNATTPFAGNTANSEKHQSPIRLAQELVKFLKTNPSNRDSGAYPQFSVSMQALEDERARTLTEINKGDGATIEKLQQMLAHSRINIQKPALKQNPDPAMEEITASKSKKKVAFKKASLDPSTVSAEYIDPDPNNHPINRENEFYALAHLKLEATGRRATGVAGRGRQPAQALFISIAETFPDKQQAWLHSPFKQLGIGKLVTDVLKSFLRVFSIRTSLRKMEIQTQLPKRPDMLLPLEARALVGDNVAQFPKVTVQLPIDTQSQTLRAAETSFSVNFNGIAKAIMVKANELFPVPGDKVEARGRSSATLKKASEGLSHFLSKAFVATLPKAMALVDATSQENSGLQKIKTMNDLSEFRDFCLERCKHHHKDLEEEAMKMHPLIAGLDEFILMAKRQAPGKPDSTSLEGLQIREASIGMFNEIRKVVNTGIKDLRSLEFQLEQEKEKMLQPSTSTASPEPHDYLEREIAEIKAYLPLYREVMEHLDPYTKPEDPTQDIQDQTRQKESLLQSAISFNAGGGTSRVYFNNAVDADHKYVGRPIEEQQQYIKEVVELAVAMALGTSDIAAIDALRAVDSRKQVIFEPHEMLERISGDDAGVIADDDVALTNSVSRAKKRASMDQAIAGFIRNPHNKNLRIAYGLDPAPELFDKKEGEKSALRERREQVESKMLAESSRFLATYVEKDKQLVTGNTLNMFLKDKMEEYATGITQSHSISSTNPSHSDRQQQHANPAVQNNPEALAPIHLGQKATEAVKHSGQTLTGAGVGKANIGEGGAGGALSDPAKTADPPTSTPINVNKAEQQKG